MLHLLRPRSGRYRGNQIAALLADTALPLLLPARRSPLPAQAGLGTAFALRGSEVRRKESLLPSELQSPQLHNVSFQRASRHPRGPSCTWAHPCSSWREALVLWGRDKVAFAHDRPLHLSAKRTCSFLRTDSRAGWVGLAKAALVRCPFCWASGGSTPEDIFKRERQELGVGQCLGKFWRWSFSRSSCPLTLGLAGVVWWRGERLQEAVRVGTCSLLFPSPGGSRARDSNTSCLFRNKATRRPTMAPTTSYSSSTATVSTPSSVCRCHTGPFQGKHLTFVQVACRQSQVQGDWGGLVRAVGGQEGWGRGWSLPPGPFCLWAALGSFLGLAPQQGQLGALQEKLLGSLPCAHRLPTGVRTEQDLYVRLIDSVTKQVSLWCTGLLLCRTSSDLSPPFPDLLPRSTNSWVRLHMPLNIHSHLVHYEKKMFPSLLNCSVSFWVGK